MLCVATRTSRCGTLRPAGAPDSHSSRSYTASGAHSLRAHTTHSVLSSRLESDRTRVQLTYVMSRMCTTHSRIFLVPDEASNILLVLSEKCLWMWKPIHWDTVRSSLMLINPTTLRYIATYYVYIEYSTLHLFTNARRQDYCSVLYSLYCARVRVQSGPRRMVES